MYLLYWDLDYIESKLFDFEDHQDMKIHVAKSLPCIVSWNHCIPISLTAENLDYIAFYLAAK